MIEFTYLFKDDGKGYYLKQTMMLINKYNEARHHCQAPAGNPPNVAFSRSLMHVSVAVSKLSAHNTTQVLFI